MKLLVGKGGETIGFIQKKSKARLQVKKEDAAIYGQANAFGAPPPRDECAEQWWGLARGNAEKCPLHEAHTAITSYTIVLARGGIWWASRIGRERMGSSAAGFDRHWLSVGRHPASYPR